MKADIYRDTSQPVEKRVEDLLGKMTLEEKIAQMDMMRGVELATKVHPAHFCSIDEDSDFQWEKTAQRLGEKGIGFVHDAYAPPYVLNRLQRYFVEETRLGIPCIFTGEALHGLSYPGATIYPVPLALGATFHPELVKEIGHQIAAETRSLGICEILAPNLDLARDPRWGRMEETFGEDVCLSSEMAAAIISGEQGEDISSPDAVAAEPKHYCVHGIPEGGINCATARAGVREIESCYLPVFQAGIEKGGAYNVMASYNNIDGEAVIASEYYLKTILRDRFGLKGYVRADFGAVSRLRTHHKMTANDKDSIRMALNAGLQVQGFDFSNEYWQKTIQELVMEGGVPLAVVDEAVSRILRVKFDLGLFENPYTDEKRYKEILRCEKHRQTSYQAALESAVLLQNRNSILPVKGEIKSIGVIGPGADYQPMGGYSSIPYGYEAASIYEELNRSVGEKIQVRRCKGCEVTEKSVTIIPRAWYENGVAMEYFSPDGDEFIKVGSGREEYIDFSWILAKPYYRLQYNNYLVHMKAVFQADAALDSGEGSFTGELVFNTADSVRVYVDGCLLIESWGNNKQIRPSAPFVFQQGKRYSLEIEYYCDVNGGTVQLGYSRNEEEFQQALCLAEESDLVIMVCGDDQYTSGEGMDRKEIKLHGRQRELIQRVGELEKPVILVLQNGKPVDLEMERNIADAIIVSWFGGELGGKAIVDILLGKYNPSGKLPVSFARDIGSLPCYYCKLPGGHSEYLEGGTEAAYPFGFGLSYTKFQYTDLEIRKMAWMKYEITITVKNIGEYSGDEIVQLYVNDMESSVVTPEKLLKGFKRVSLRKGEEKQVKFILDPDSFKLFDRTGKWVIEPGRFRIMIGASSEDIRLEETIVCTESSEDFYRKELKERKGDNK